MMHWHDDKTFNTHSVVVYLPTKLLKQRVFFFLNSFSKKMAKLVLTAATTMALAEYSKGYVSYVKCSQSLTTGSMMRYPITRSTGAEIRLVKDG